MCEYPTMCVHAGYVTSLLGRKRFLPSICSQNYMERSHCERQAVNFVVQGSAADLCKCCMVELAGALCRECPTAKYVQWEEWEGEGRRRRGRRGRRGRRKRERRGGGRGGGGGGKGRGRGGEEEEGEEEEEKEEGEERRRHMCSQLQ